MWTRKYTPKRIDEIPQKAAASMLNNFVKNYTVQKKKAALLYGPTGTCKSCVVHTIANESGYEIIEVNASDFRNSEELQAKVGQAIKQKSLFGNQKIILVDEIDGIAGNEDRGGVPTLTSLIAETRFPIIMTANDPWDSKFSSLRSKSLMIEFPALDVTAIFGVLKNICVAEKVQSDDVILKTLARRSGGDLRAAITDLQTLSIDKKMSTNDLAQDISRNRIDTMMNALTKILRSTDINIAVGAFDSVEEELEHCLLWLDENVHKQYLRPQDLARAYDMLSRADVFLGRIKRRQHWRFLSYVNTLLTAGVSSAKDEKSMNFVNYSQTMRLLKIWQMNRKYAARNSIVEKLGLTTHSSKRKTVQDSLPFLKYKFQKSSEFSQQVIKMLRLDDEEIEWMKN